MWVSLQYFTEHYSAISADGVRIGDLPHYFKSHDSKDGGVILSCVCCKTAKSKYYSFSSKKCALFQIANTIKSLVSSDIDLTRIKSKNICLNCVKTVSQISTIRGNVIKACKTQTSDTATTISTTTTPVDRSKRSA